MSASRRLIVLRGRFDDPPRPCAICETLWPTNGSSYVDQGTRLPICHNCAQAVVWVDEGYESTPIWREATP